MKFLNSYIVTIILIWCTTLLQAAEATIDRNPVRVNETFELTLHLESAPVTQPELKGLPGDLEVLRNSNFYRKSTINGVTSVQSGWTFTIKALNEGIFTIPTIDIDGDKTQPVSIKVLPAVSTTTIDGQADAIRISADISSREVYVQQQLTYTIRLYRAVQAQYASLTEPELEGALIETLGDDVQYETVIDSVRYRVLERKYAIFPQQSGEYTIPGVTYSAEVPTGRQKLSTFGSLRGRSQSVSLSTDDIVISVKPIPAGVNFWWLPAAALSVQQQWQPATEQLEVGTPVTWTYSLIAKGLTATQIPDLTPADVTGLKFYPEAAKAEDLLIDGQLTGKRTQTVAVIATEPGEVTIPEMTVDWWDVKADKHRTLVIPARTIEIISNAETESTIQVPTKPSVADPVTPSQLTSTQPEQAVSEGVQSQLVYWQVATGLLLILWLITLFFRGRSRPIESTQGERAEQVSNKKPGFAVKANAIERSLSDGNLAEAHSNIIRYCQQSIPSVHSLRDLIKQSGNQSLNEQLTSIERARYGMGKMPELDASVFTQTLTEQLTSLLKEASGDKQQQAGIAPLHPDHDR